MYKILLLEDDELFLNTLEDFLSSEGFIVDTSKDGLECLDLNYKNNYDLYIFDINVPKLNGLELLKTLRESSDDTPAIFLTSYKDNETIKDAFIKGCDDFIKKPVDLDELILRIKAILKRQNKTFTSIYFSDNILFNKQEKRLYKAGVDLDLPSKVLDLLELFIENKNKIVTKEMIINKLWASSQNHSEGSIRVYVNQIKNIFDNKEVSIKNIKGIGYRFEF